MSRTGQQRIDATLPAIDRRDAFKLRVDAASGNWQACADLMAEAITMQIDANHLETVGKNGKVTVSIEDVCAAHCMIAAKNAYLRARYGSGQKEQAA